MDTPLHLSRSFSRLGMRLKTAPLTGRWRRPVGDFDLDVARDRQGEYFLLRRVEGDPTEFVALDVQPGLRQLLLLARTSTGKQKFLCGFDERHLFTAAVPGESVRGVHDAIRALKPPLVRTQEVREGLRGRDALRRRNAAYVRQGEWFFVPAPDLIVPEGRIRRHEPLSRGAGSKPHLCAEAARLGGESVMVCHRHMQGLPIRKYEALLRRDPDARRWGWVQRVRDPELYVRGEIRHRDHATIHLNIWHRVLMNTEAEAPGARSVVFLD